MARTSIDRDSVEFVRVPVTAPAGVTLGGQAVHVAVVAVGEHPTELDWNEAEWDGTKVRLLVGPGNVPLEVGQYAVWVRITDDPEVPVLLAGQIQVT